MQSDSPCSQLSRKFPIRCCSERRATCLLLCLSDSECYGLSTASGRTLSYAALGLLGGLAVSSFCDWGIIGPLMILLFWHFHDRPRGVALAMLVPFLGLGLPALSWAISDPVPLSLGVLGYYTVGFGLATTLMLNYNGQQGRPLKWFFYGYYPGHLLALWALAQALAL